jgi:uncharacterized protein YcfJ
MDKETTMKKLILATALSCIASGAYADKTPIVNTGNATVRDVYVTKTVQTPQQVKSCNFVEVPIYGNKEATAGEAVTGAIIGGVIGNQFGGGSGKDAMTVLGAIVGANAVDNKKTITGHRIEERCVKDTYYVDKKVTVYSHSVATFTYEGNTYKLEFQK